MVGFGGLMIWVFEREAHGIFNSTNVAPCLAKYFSVFTYIVYAMKCSGSLTASFVLF
jgi:hypothetical protein